ncbi:MAG: sensor histidine kinase [Candidatus Nealsonbacteria bacterium]|nr:sensor histidine kinase [Candidatus Nealsonbacteria bacterium]
MSEHTDVTAGDVIASDCAGLPDHVSPGSRADLETVLNAWHSATLRLEQTHEALREEVRRLTDELEAKNRQLAQKNRLADLGKMAAHVAHEVRNNLVPVTLYLSLLRRRISDDSGSVDVLDKVAAGFTALEATVNDLLHFTSDRDPVRRPFSLRKLLDDVFGSLSPQLSAQAIDVEVDVPKNLVVTGDKDMLRRVVLNLVLNALDVMPEGGSLVATSCNGPRGIELEIADDGPGLTDDVMAQAFEPFFAAKSGGTGLGLAIVQRIIEAHGGEVTAANCPEGGAAFTLLLPQTDALMEAAA